MKIIIWTTSIVAFLYLALGAYLYIKQRSFLYFPQPYKQNQYPSITINQPDAQLDIITLSLTQDTSKETVEANQEKPAIIYFGGNAEAVIHSAPLFEPLLTHYDVYLVNYRGYGASTGNITEANNYDDALAIYERISQSHSNISVVGRSLGSGVASYLAAKKPVEKLILITPFDSIQAVAQETFPIYPLGLLLKDTYPSIERAADISANILILAAKNDQVVPAHHANALSKAFKSPQYAEIKQANHADIMTKEDALHLFYDFFE